MESIRIGDDVVVTLVRIEGGQVRLMITAPRSVPILRTELIEHEPPDYGRGNAN